MTPSIRPLWATFALGLLAVAGCSPKSSSLSRTTTPAVVAPTTSLVTGYAYVSDSFDDRIHTYEVRGTPTQSLVHVGTVAADFPDDLVSAPSKGFVYADTSQGLLAFAADANGRLTQVGQTQVNAAGLLIDPLERFVFVLADRGATLESYLIGAGGALTRVSAAPINGDADQLVVDPSGTLLLTADRSAPLQLFSIDASGLLTKRGELPLTGVHKLLLNPDGQHVHVWTDASLLETVALDPASGSATWLGSPLALSPDTFDLAMVGTDLFTSRVDLANLGFLPMSRYRWDATARALVALSTAATPPLDATGLLQTRGELYLIGGFAISVLNVKGTNEVSLPSGVLAAFPSTRLPPRSTVFVWR